MSKRVQRTVRIVRKQAGVSEEAFCSAVAGKVILWMDEVVPAHLDGKPTPLVHRKRFRAALRCVVGPWVPREYQRTNRDLCFPNVFYSDFFHYTA